VFFEYISLSGLTWDFSFSWEGLSATGSVVLIGLLLAFVGYLVRAVWGAVTLLAGGVFLFIFSEHIPFSSLLH
jgi:hypothetical protein